MKIKKSNVGWISIITISLSPLIPWYFILPLSLRFPNISITATSVSELLALIGVTMFSISLILSIRLKIFEDFFGGMNKVYVAHHTIGSIAFMLLLMHPLTAAAALLPYSLKSAAIFILPGKDWSINFGISALLLMMSLLILTFFIKLSYQIWRFTHKFLGLAFFLACIHGFYVSADISQYLGIKIYMLIFLIGGLAAFTYKTLLGKLFTKEFVYSVVQIRQLEDAVVEISLRPMKMPIKFVPGQFAFVRFEGSGISHEVHPFSISSSALDTVLTFTIKAEGDYTKKLTKLKPGDKAFIEGAFGRFSYKRFPSKQQIWIAGGIGITPFLSMAKNIDPNYSIDLYYSIRAEKEAVYLQDMQTLSQQHPTLRVIPYFSKTQGRLTAEIIEKTSGDITKKDIFICGPPPMMKSIRQQLLTLHVPNNNIHSEEFQLL